MTLTVHGPQCSERGDPNPFLDHRLAARFEHAGSGRRYTVPGFLAVILGR